MRTACSAITLLAATFAARGQNAAPAFDVASLKPSERLAPGQNYNANLGSIQNDALTLTNATLADCVKFAYGLVSDDQLASEDWVKSKNVRFDVVGKAASSTPRGQMLLMLRTLLSERFHLEIHTEQRKVAHMALTVSKSGPKLHEVEANAATSHMTYRIGSITHNQITMHALALLLSRQLKETVLDETGLKGVYDLKLEWTPDNTPVSADRPDSAPSIYTAVQEQLGLRLENRKDPMDVVVIDRADRTPVAN
jgi:uncharacterized protein (TIGR03435 family)